jgi:hypothetical protein
MQAHADPLQPPGIVAHEFGTQNPDGTSAAAARDAAARDAAAAGTAAGDEAAARDQDGTAPLAYADVGTGQPCMLVTCWAQGTSESPTVPARVMSRDTQALLVRGSVVTLLRPV